MRKLLQAAIVASLTSTGPALAYQTGLSDLTISDATKQRDLEGFIWYPTDDAAAPTEQLGNPVWRGIDAIKDAEPATGKFPLVVLSHGMYGNARNQSWLAADLAKRGYVVAAVDHPGTSTWSRDVDDARQMWERPMDLSRVIDHVTAAPELGAIVDPDRVFMAGHSLGGFTAIALAGGRYDAEAFEGFCDDQPDELVCGIFDKWSIAQSPEDRKRMEADLSDRRIKGFAVFDLGGTQTFSKASLGSISQPMLIFGAPKDVEGTSLDLDVESRALIAALPKKTTEYLEFETLSHFDFLGECRPDAIEVLTQEKPEDVFVCIDGDVERHDEHRMIIERVANFFADL